MRSLIALIFFVFVKSSLFCQTVWINKGALISTGHHSIIYCGGLFQQDKSSTFFHNGKWQLKGDLINDGSIKARGDVDLQGNLTNNGTLECDSGEVNFSGSTQKISGISPLRFFSVKLSGSGVKQFRQRTTANGILNIADRQLDTDTSHFVLGNNDTEAIKRTQGFISSAKGGAFFRLVKPNNNYLYPVGAFGLYAPAIISVTSDDTLGVRFAKADASMEGLNRLFVDLTICSTNPEYYHILSGDQKGGALIRLFMPLPNQWNVIATRPVEKEESWKSIPNAKFEISGNNVIVEFITAPLSEAAFISGRLRPDPPLISGSADACHQDQVTYAVKSKTGDKMSWNTSGKIVNLSADSLDITWDKIGTNVVSAFITEDNGCSSSASKLLVNVNSNPVSKILIEAPDFFFENEIFRFLSHSKDVKTWEWTVDGKYAGADSSFTYSFDKPGEYMVRLKVTNENNCTDYLDTLIKIMEGIVFPDSFSPNGDGINDELVFLNSGLKVFSLEIYNRWGVPVYSTLLPKLNWDGRDQAGNRVSPGTYFYAIKAGLGNKEYKKKGMVSLFY